MTNKWLEKGKSLVQIINEWLNKNPSKGFPPSNNISTTMDGYPDIQPNKKGIFTDFPPVKQISPIVRITDKDITFLTELRDAALTFEKILPKHSYRSIDTKFDYEYGELHRVYYDVAILENEDQNLIKVINPFIKHTRMTLTHYDTEVINLREYFGIDSRSILEILSEINVDKNEKTFTEGYPYFPIDSDWSFIYKELMQLNREDILEQIRSAVVRGWCHPKNSNKEMDVNLANAITEEIFKLIKNN